MIKALLLLETQALFVIFKISIKQHRNEFREAILTFSEIFIEMRYLICIITCLFLYSCQMGAYYSRIRIGHDDIPPTGDKSLTTLDTSLSAYKTDLEIPLSNHTLSPIETIDKEPLAEPIVAFKEKLVTGNPETITSVTSATEKESPAGINSVHQKSPKPKRITEKNATEPLDTAWSCVGVLGFTALFGLLMLVWPGFIWFFAPMAIVSPLFIIGGLIGFVIALIRFQNTEYLKKYKLELGLWPIAYLVSVTIIFLLFSMIFL